MTSTVKRKFNALLGTIGSRSATEKAAANADPATGDHLRASTDSRRPSTSPAPSAMASDLEFLAKKRRIGGASSKPGFAALAGDRVGSIIPLAATTATSTTKAPTTISNVTLRKWTPTGGPAAPGSKEGPPIKYCPGDREQLIRRLATFQDLTDWTPKPDRVSEIEWAKRGWVCQGKERVRCTLCAKELVVKLNRKEVDGKEVAVLVAADIAEELVEKYVELILTSHQEDCLWRKKGCDDSLLRLSILSPRATLEGLRQRYDELLERKDFLPYEFNLRLPDGFDIDTLLSHLPANFFTEPPPQATKTAMTDSSSKPPPVNRTALALAALGWQGLNNARGGAVPNSASCQTCLRRLGLWMFKSKEIDPETNTILVPAAMDHLDPLREHRFFCPWKNGQVQRNPGSNPLAAGETDVPGWEILVRTLRNEAFVRKRVNPPTSSAVHGRSKSSIPASAMAPATPARPTTAGGGGGRPNSMMQTPDVLVMGSPVDGLEEEDEETRTKKDQAMMARLRRVKSLFNTKAGNKLKRASSRPGTGHSTSAGGGKDDS